VLKGGHFKGNISGDAGLRFEFGVASGGSTTVVLDAPNTFTGPVTLAGGNVRVNHAGAFGPQPNRLAASSGDLQFDVPFTLASLRLDGGRLSGSGTLTLPSTHLEVRGGSIDLPLHGPEQIIKRSYKTAHFGALPATTTVEQGTLSIGNWSWGAPASQGITVAPRDAILLVSSTFKLPIKLSDASGFAHSGALSVDAEIQGDVDLGPAGSVLTTNSLTGFGVIRGAVTGGTLTHAGHRSIALASGTNTYTGPTILGFNNFAATLTLFDGGRLTTTSGVEVNSGAALSLNDAGAQTHADRLADSIPVTLNGGTLALRAGNTSPATETVGPVTAATGLSTVELVQQGASEHLTLASLQRGRGAAVHFKGIDLNATPDGPRIFISNPPALTNGIIGSWAFIDGASEFATYDSTMGVQRLPIAGRPTSFDAAGPSDNLLLQSRTPLGENRVINALTTAGSDQPVDLGGHTLNVASGGIYHPGTAPIVNGTLTAGGSTPGTAGAHLHVIGSGQRAMNISANIADGPAGPLSLVLTRPGTLSGTNTYTGDTFVNAGTVDLLHAAALPAGTNLHLATGAIRLHYSSANPLQLGDVFMRQGSAITSTAGAAARPASILAESGEIIAPLVGGAPITKITRQTLTLGGNNSAHHGIIDANQGILWGRFHGSALGSGTVRVHAEGRVLGSATPTPLSTSIELRGGELSPYLGHVNFSGPVAVLEDSALFTWTGRDDPSDTSLTLSGPLSIAANKTLRIRGPSPAIISGPQSHGAGAAIIVEEGATLTMNSDAGKPPPASSPNVEVLARAALHFNSTQHLGSLHVARDAAATLSPSSQPGGKVLRVNTLRVDGTLDLANNALIAEPRSFESAIALADSIRRITSSTYAATPGVVLAGGFAKDVLGPSQGPLTFMGERVEDHSALFRFTLLGDANLDGNVNFHDLVRLAQNYGQPSRGWAFGEFTADDEVNFADLVALAQNYGDSLPTPPIAGAPAGFSRDWARAIAQVPEPAALSLLPLAYAATTRRRRNSRKEKGPVALSRGGTLLGQS
jgi:hypothetical protein